MYVCTLVVTSAKLIAKFA